MLFPFAQVPFWITQSSANGKEVAGKFVIYEGLKMNSSCSTKKVKLQSLEFVELFVSLRRKVMIFCSPPGIAVWQHPPPLQDPFTILSAPLQKGRQPPEKEASLPPEDLLAPYRAVESQPTAVNLLRVEEREKGRLDMSRKELILPEGRQLRVTGERTVAFELETEMEVSSMSPETGEMKGLGKEEFLHVIRKPGRWQPGFVPKGKGMVMLPQLSGQPGRVMGEEDDGTKRRWRRRRRGSMAMAAMVAVEWESLTVDVVSAI